MQPVVLGDKRGYLLPLACPGKRLFVFEVFMPVLILMYKEAVR
jgi:hypothetical protein